MTQPPAQALAAIWSRSRDGALARVAVVAAAVEALQGGALTDDQRAAGEREAHRLAGSLGTFGLHSASAAARELELLLGRALSNSADAPRAVALVHELRAGVSRSSAAAPAGAPAEPAQTSAASHVAEHATTPQQDPDATASRRIGSRTQPVMIAGQRILLIVQAEAPDATRMSELSGARALRLLHARDAAEARALMRSHHVAAAVVRIDTESADDAGIDLVGDLTAADPSTVVMVAAERLSTEQRLAAVRAGARRFVDPSLPVERLVDEVTAFLASRPSGAQILVVDDDPDVLAAMQAILGPVGIEMIALAEPLRFWEVLVETAPDLVVLDIEMPGVNGLELCRLIRADPRWRTMPVLFLSAHRGADVVEQVFTAGADDFVNKPVIGPELEARIRNRLDRVRLLRLLAETDPLTGLANRRKLAEEFRRLQSLRQRYGHALSLAVLDVDHFKQVNDRYGHDVGDLVLQRLATHLLASCRGEDVVARIGGEEFVVAMLGSRSDAAVTRLGHVLDQFRAEPTELPDGTRLHVGVSGGVAEMSSSGADLHTLYRSADQALMRAKAAGRGRVLAAD